jgi:hypothetical protein
VPHELGVQLLTTLPLAYICVCTYFALFRINAFDYNKLLPRWGLGEGKEEGEEEEGGEGQGTVVLRAACCGIGGSRGRQLGAAVSEAAAPPNAPISQGHHGRGADAERQPHVPLCARHLLEPAAHDTHGAAGGKKGAGAGTGAGRP